MLGRLADGDDLFVEVLHQALVLSLRGVPEDQSVETLHKRDKNLLVGDAIAGVVRADHNSHLLEAVLKKEISGAFVLQQPIEHPFPTLLPSKDNNILKDIPIESPLEPNGILNIILLDIENILDLHLVSELVQDVSEFVVVLEVWDLCGGLQVLEEFLGAGVELGLRVAVVEVQVE